MENFITSLAIFLMFFQNIDGSDYHIDYSIAKVPIAEWLEVALTPTVEECVIDCAEGCNKMYEIDMSCNAVIYDESNNLCTRAAYVAPPSEGTGLRIAWASSAHLAAWFAIDRYLYGSRAKSNIWLGSRAEHPWYAVDLILTQKVWKVEMVQRPHDCASKMRNIEIRVGHDRPFPRNTNGDKLYKSNTICGFFGGPAVKNTTATVECSTPILGRYVTLQQTITYECETDIAGVSWSEILILSEPAEYSGPSIEILLRESTEDDPHPGTCPKSHPYAYNGGAGCCEMGMEDISSGNDWVTKGSHGLLHYDSTTCGKTTVPCPGKDSCYNYQFQRYACYYEGVNAKSSDMDVRNGVESVEECHEHALSIAGSEGFTYLKRRKRCWVKGGSGQVQLIYKPLEGLYSSLLLPCP